MDLDLKHWFLRQSKGNAIKNKDEDRTGDWSTSLANTLDNLKWTKKSSLAFPMHHYLIMNHTFGFYQWPLYSNGKFGRQRQKNITTISWCSAGHSSMGFTRPPDNAMTETWIKTITPLENWPWVTGGKPWTGFLCSNQQSRKPFQAAPSSTTW